MSQPVHRECAAAILTLLGQEMLSSANVIVGMSTLSHHGGGDRRTHTKRSVVSNPSTLFDRKRVAAAIAY